MNKEMEKRKAERIQKWSSKIYKNGKLISKSDTKKTQIDINKCLEHLHTLRIMAYPELNKCYKMDRTKIHLIHPAKKTKEE